MRTILLLLGVIMISSATSGTAAAADTSIPEPPRAKVIPKQLSIHGDVRTDNYYWLRERENPEVIRYLEEENAYAEAVMAHTKALQQTLFDEIVGRIKQDDATVPYQDNGYFYYERYVEAGEYPVYCRRSGSEAPEEIILDVNALAKGRGFIHVRGLSVSPSNELLAYGSDEVGRRLYSIRVRNLATGKDYPESIPGADGDAVWANDNKTLFYTRKHPETLRSYQIYRHVLGTEPARDELVYEEKDDTFRCSLSKTKSHRFILIESRQTLATEVRYLDADQPGGEFRVFLTRQRDHEYRIDHYGDTFYIRTNDGAKNFKLMATPTTATDKSNWTEVVGHRPDVFLGAFELFRDYLVLSERERGLKQLRVVPRAGGESYAVAFDEPAYVVDLGENRETDTNMLRYVYTSLTTPNSTYDFDMVTRKKTLRKEETVLGDFDKSNYVTERLYAPAVDGTQIPISLVYRKGMKQEGGNPLLLYGYGSYGYSTEPAFRSDRLSMLDRGFVFAIAHIRGGQEMGRDWYENGKLMKKKNTFTDFIDCAKYLIAKKYTSSNQLFAHGGSAGGLLMGAITNMAPELFKGVVNDVSFVDVITTMLDPDIPLTTSEYDEWGNPNEKAAYEYMLSYSPYDQIEAKAYPNLLVTTGLHDSQVQYWEPAKYVAKLREMKTDSNRLLLTTDMESGHGGSYGRFKRYHKIALRYAFMLDLVERAK